MSTYAALLGVSYLLVLSLLLPRIEGVTERRFHFCVLHALFAMVLVCILRTKQISPGIVKDSTIPDLEGLTSSKCDKCKVTRPERAAHCHICETCVLKMDQHCYWLNCCIGFRNQKSYFLFLVYQVLYLIHIFYLLVHTGLPSNMAMGVPIFLSWPFEIAGLVLFIHKLRLSTYLLSMNMTCVELEELSEVFPMAYYHGVDEGLALRDIHAYDLGTWRNVCSLLDVGPGVGSFCLPIPIPPPPPLLWLLRLLTWPLPTECGGDGVRYPHNNRGAQALEAMKERIESAKNRDMEAAMAPSSSSS